MKRASKAKAKKAAKVLPKRSRKVAAKRSGRWKIDFTGWDLTAPDSFAAEVGDIVEAVFAEPIAARVADVAKAAVKEAVKIASEQYDAYALMLVEFEPDRRDPLMLRVDVPLGRTEDEEPHWQVSLTEVLDELVADITNSDTGKIGDDEELRRTAERLRDGLRAMAAKLDHALLPVETSAVHETEAT